ncbi:DUF4184 family protein [Promicromonospora sp. NPDC019610]|uniref:DUF4184 family protein n=1 Tax=Promicromonospora sp. NPDC019610 TaxID=3364405 RepID=UPI00378C3821
MPFTLSHPAAVLPLLRRPFSAAALVAGAVAPDLPYFARSTPVPVSAQSWYEPFLNATTSHSLAGAVTVSLPYALALYGFLRVARRPVGALLPAVVRPGVGGPGADGRVEPGPATAGELLRRSGWVLLSLVIGIATHLVWDSFTHGDGWVVTHVPLLSATAFGDLTWARLLQHVSTVVGLVVIAGYLWRRRGRMPGWGSGRRGSAGRGSLAWRTTRRGLWAVAGVAVAGAVVNTLGWWSAGSSSDSVGLAPRDMVEGVLSDVATGAGAALIGALLLYVVGWWAARGARSVARG